MLNEKEIYVSVDVETDGPIPGPHSMLSIGAAAYFSDKTLVDTYSANLETLPEAEGHPDTMEWWSKNKKAWDTCRKDTRPPSEVMKEFAQWCWDLPGKPVFVGYPAGFDFTFVYWYLIQFVGKSPFSFSGIDIKSVAMAAMKKPYRSCTKRRMPKSWFDDLPHTHVAVDDAIEQGALFCNILEELGMT